MKSVTDIIDATIGVEGGYSNNAADLGGPTRWGVTQSEARRDGYDGDMHDYPRPMAVALYLRKYWTAPKISQLLSINEAVATKLFDIGVNMGVSWPGLFLQQALNGLNGRGKLYADITEDGDIGPATRTALSAYLSKRGADGVDVLLKALNVLQGARYFTITRAREANEDFLYGWLRTRISI